MATRKKVDVVAKPKATKAKVEPDAQVIKRKLTNLETAMKLNVVLIKKGSHLTVRSYPDGHEELEWDDEALARDVREAIASVEK